MERNDTFSIGLVQHACTDDIESNYTFAENGIREAASRGAQIICLQELFRSRYFCSVEDSERFSLAEDLKGETLTRFSPLAAELEVVVVLPIFERRAPGLYHNSAIVLDADGSSLGAYRKMHIPDDPLYYEKFYFTPGDSSDENGGFRVFKTRYADLGVLICWDQWYPEAARLTSLLGAEVLFYPTAIGWHPREKESEGNRQAAAWKTIQRSHAIANGIYVASANRVGHEPTPGTDGIEFFGQSFICDPFGEVLSEAPTGKDHVLVETCSRRHLEEVRQNWPFLRDRRVEAYSGITQRFLD